ncbi:glycogen biosynthesis protein GlgD [Clostridium homopropionicum DSM 5847]|uniref:Glycogen biosynthesis protein GlgD n=1 Tax=Clostridium homopropionicum DSM 5847 TaxID=1121318 RepID=A0A0L6Z7P1_9CLOT|nr:glucose-1-phosphate adenylyltransferase subunit GlgD [Clostridium homopropionicum]KOA18986.1 glycogen biosynthesis protein GlgD [Clostridium homopropionicum DSM 5847]SFG42577.1 glucose-1-phosphate adenylyltransferase [Clostridium homopropionicum]
MLKEYMGIISLNEDNSHIKSLTSSRPLAAIPIFGRYRIIDFVLSNMVNAGITNIGIYTQDKSRSLLHHLQSGKPWDLNRKINGLFLFNFNFSDIKTNDIYLLKDNIDYLYRSKQNSIIFSSSNMICNIDYKKAIEYHEKEGSDVTIIYKKVNNADSSFTNCSILNLSSDNKVISVGKNIGVNPICNISMDMFIMKKKLLLDIIKECVSTGSYKSIKHCLYSNNLNLNIKAYAFNGYLECVNSSNSYYKINMDMLNQKTSRELFFGTGLIYTKGQDAPPTKYAEGSAVSNSLIANGCIIEGSVKNSIISRRVVIGKGAKLDGCIILQNCEIRENAKLTRVIMDKNVVIEKNKELKGDIQFPVVIEKNSYYYSLAKHA